MLFVKFFVWFVLVLFGFLVMGFCFCVVIGFCGWLLCVSGLSGCWVGSVLFCFWSCLGCGGCVVGGCGVSVGVLSCVFLELWWLW